MKSDGNENTKDAAQRESERETLMNLQRKTLFYARLTCGLCAAALGVLLAAGWFLVPETIRFTRSVGASLEQAAQLAQRADALTQYADTLTETLRILETAAEKFQVLEAASGKLETLDISRLNNFLAQTDNADLSRLDDTLKLLEELDLRGLKDTIGKLESIVEPLSRFAGVFR